jgi:uncharacterized protein (DUF1800 family)
VKSPFEMVVSAVRAMGADTADTFTLAQRVADLGEPLYGKIEPTGYPNTGDAWLNTAGVMGRINFANALAAGQVPGVSLDGSRLAGKDPLAVARAVLSRDPSRPTQAALEKLQQSKLEKPQQVAGVVMSSPDFQRR